MSNPVADIRQLFATPIYQARLAGIDNRELAAACRSIAEDDKAGRRWSARNAYPGFTSYASLNDLPWRFPEFKTLAKALKPHVKDFAKALALDLAGRKLTLDSLWINILEPGGAHGGHIHPHSIISGVYYVETPEGAGGLRFEDPRLGLMMAAPARKAKAHEALQPFVTVPAESGALLLWESWLRHEVPVNQSAAERVSVSFNFRWG